jgi:hypothetical protein
MYYPPFEFHYLKAFIERFDKEVVIHLCVQNFIENFL